MNNTWEFDLRGAIEKEIDIALAERGLKPMPESRRKRFVTDMNNLEDVLIKIEDPMPSKSDIGPAWFAYFKTQKFFIRAIARAVYDIMYYIYRKEGFR